MAAITTAPATANQLLQMAKAQANAVTAGPLAQLAQQIAAQNNQTANATKAVQGYFQGLGNYVNDAAGQVGKVGQNLDQQLTDLGTSAQNSLQAYSPKGDADVGASGMPALVSALAQQKGLADTQQSGYQDLVNSLKGAYGTQGQQDLANINQSGQAALGPLYQKVANAQTQNESLTNSNLVKLRQQEITNNIDEGALGVKQFTAQSTASNNATKNAIAQENAGTAASRAAANAAYQKGLLNVDWAKQATGAQSAQYLDSLHQAETNAKNGGGALTPIQNNDMMTSLSQAIAALRGTSGKGLAAAKNSLEEGTGVIHTTSSVNGRTLTNSVHLPKVNNELVNAAAEYLAHGRSVSPQTAAALAQMGLRNVLIGGKPLKVK